MRPKVKYVPFILCPFIPYARTSKKHSDSSLLARLVVNLAAFVRRESDHEMKPNTCMLRHFHKSKTPTFSFCPWTSEVTNVVFHLDNWRVSEVSDTLSGVYKFELVRYVYIYICMEVCMP